MRLLKNDFRVEYLIYKKAHIYGLFYGLNSNKKEFRIPSKLFFYGFAQGIAVKIFFLSRFLTRQKKITSRIFYLHRSSVNFVCNV